MKINRRSFLKETLAAGTMLAGAGSLISACSGISRSDYPDRIPAEQSTMELDEARNAILYYASLAPSGHNSQPWYVKVKSQNEKNGPAGARAQHRNSSHDSNPGGRNRNESARSQSPGEHDSTVCLEGRLFKALSEAGQFAKTGELVCAVIIFPKLIGPGSSESSN